MSGMVIVVGDSYMIIYGVFGVLGFGIGMLEIEYLLVMQMLVYCKFKIMCVSVQGELFFVCFVKDIVFELFECIGVDGVMGYVIEFVGEVISVLSVEG